MRATNKWNVKKYTQLKDSIYQQGKIPIKKVDNSYLHNDYPKLNTNQRSILIEEKTRYRKKIDVTRNARVVEFRGFIGNTFHAKEQEDLILKCL